MLPDWVIKSICVSYGARLTRRPARIHAGFDRLPGAYMGNTSTMSFHDPQATRFENGKVAKGSLPNEEYEFWIGSPYLANEYASCRFCAGYHRGIEERKEHYKTSKADCPRMIKAVAWLLRKDSKCTICDNHTGKKLWGFPLCSNQCIAQFKFGMVQSNSFQAAKAIVQMRQVKA